MNESKAKFECPECKATFTENRNLTRHCKNVHQSCTNSKNQKPEGKFSCSTCAETFTTKGNLTRHNNEKICSNDTALKIYCPGCNESFTRYTSLIRHIDCKHKEEPGTCSE